MSYQILLFCEWLWHAVWQPESLLAYSLTSEYTVTFFKSIDKHYFNVFFIFYTFYLSASRGCVTLKNFGFVHWLPYELRFPASLIYYNYYWYYYYYFDFTQVFMKIQIVPIRLWMLLVFEFFLKISESSPHFRHSYQLSVC